MNKDLKIIPGQGVKTILQTTRSRYGTKKLIIPKVAPSKALVPYTGLGSSKPKISFITNVGKKFQTGLKAVAKTGLKLAGVGTAVYVGARGIKQAGTRIVQNVPLRRSFDTRGRFIE